MTRDIVSKLDEHLSKGVGTECEVVYLLAEIRKLLERDMPKAQPSALRMFCHWALHVDLTNAHTTQQFLELVDKWIVHSVAGFLETHPWTISQEYYLFKDFMYLDAFRRQLSTFLGQYGLSRDIAEDDNKWYNFLAAYGGVIEDGSLSIKANPNPLQAVDEIIFSKAAASEEDQHLPFSIQWDVRLKDGRMLRTIVGAVPSEKRTFAHIHLIATPSLPS